MATGRHAFIKSGYVDNSNKTENKGRHINLNYIEGGYFNENGYKRSSGHVFCC